MRVWGLGFGDSSWKPRVEPHHKLCATMFPSSPLVIRLPFFFVRRPQKRKRIYWGTQATNPTLDVDLSPTSTA